MMALMIMVMCNDDNAYDDDDDDDYGDDVAEILMMNSVWKLYGLPIRITQRTYEEDFL